MIAATAFLRGPAGEPLRANELQDGTLVAMVQDNEVIHQYCPRYGEAVLHTAQTITTESGIQLTVSNNAQIAIDDPERNQNIGSGGAYINVQAIGVLRIGVVRDNVVSWEAARVVPADLCHVAVVPVVAPGRGYLIASDTPDLGYIMVTGAR